MPPRLFGDLWAYRITIIPPSWERWKKVKKVILEASKLKEGILCNGTHNPLIRIELLQRDGERMIGMQFDELMVID